MKTKRLIINADDFGLSDGINRAIIYTFKKGIVTSTSFIVNTDYYGESVKLLKRNKKLSVGIHLNLTVGKPLTKSKSLKNDKGLFLGKTTWFDGYYKNIELKDAENELNTQIIKAKSSGLDITHLDGHNHIHIFPKIIDITIKLAKKHNIKYIRLPSEKIANGKKELAVELKLRNMVEVFSKIAKSKILKSNLKTTDYFYGMLKIHNMDFKALSKILNSIKYGVSELMVHPAFTAIESDRFHRLKQRENEVELLTNIKIKEIIKKNNINLISFSEK